MVIHDRSYARWDGERGTAVRAAPIIAEAGIRQGAAVIFRRKIVAVLLTLWALGPFAAGLLMMFVFSYIKKNLEAFPQFEGAFDDPVVSAVLTLSGETIFFYWSYMQVFFVIIACLMVGAGLIADDRRTNALELYLSRPVGVAQYMLGKFCSIAFFVGLVTVLPAATAVLVQLALSWDEPGEATRLAELFARTLAAGAIWVVVPSLLILTASSLSKKARNAAIAWFAFLFALEGPISNILVEVFRNDSFYLLSFRHNIWQTTAWLLGNTDSQDFVQGVPVWQSAVVLGAWVLICAGLIRRRVKPVEVVA